MQSLEISRFFSKNYLSRPALGMDPGQVRPSWPCAKSGILPTMLWDQGVALAPCLHHLWADK